MELAPGSRVADYEVEEFLGSGAFSAVWRGTHVESGERVALKVLLPALAGDPEVVKRFRREAEFLGRIASDHVVGIHEFLEDASFGMVLVMEYVEGELLSDIFDRTTLTVEEGIDLGVDILAGVADLHAARIIHRDLKPSNIIVRHLPTGGVQAVIFDFSLSRLGRRKRGAGKYRAEERSNSALTAANFAIGTLHFMSPEQMLDARSVTERSDLYAVGALLFRGVAGEYAFREDDHRLARAKVMKEARRLNVGREDASARGLADVIAKAMRRRPEERWTSAREMLDALKELQPRKSRAIVAPPVGSGTVPRITSSGASMTIAASRTGFDARVRQLLRSKRGRREAILVAAGGFAIYGAGILTGMAASRGSASPEDAGASAITAATVHDGGVHGVAAANAATDAAGAASGGGAAVLELDEPVDAGAPQGWRPAPQQR